MRTEFWRRLPAARARFSAAGALLGGRGSSRRPALFSAPRHPRRSSRRPGTPGASPLKPVRSSFPNTMEPFAKKRLPASRKTPKRQFPPGCVAHCLCKNLMPRRTCRSQTSRTRDKGALLVQSHAFHQRFATQAGNSHNAAKCDDGAAAGAATAGAATGAATTERRLEPPRQPRRASRPPAAGRRGRRRRGARASRGWSSRAPPCPAPTLRPPDGSRRSSRPPAPASSCSARDATRSRCDRSTSARDWRTATDSGSLLPRSWRTNQRMASTHSTTKRIHGIARMARMGSTTVRSSNSLIPILTPLSRPAPTLAEGIGCAHHLSRNGRLRLGCGPVGEKDGAGRRPTRRGSAWQAPGGTRRGRSRASPWG